VMVTDLRMPGMDGMELLVQVTKTWPDVPVIMLTAHGNVPLAVEAMRQGAFEFLLKPFDRVEVLAIVERALLLARRNSAPPTLAAAVERSLLGDSDSLRSLKADVTRAAKSSATVLILGESGTGKELVARAVHEQSPRRGRPFVKLNCAAFPAALLESEIFGYEKGAFTGATKRKPGRVELAEGGTLLLDEIGDYSAETQVKLLRILQEREISRLGGTDTFPVDVRFIAATNKNLPALVTRGEFRQDLYYRLNVLPVSVPPLRARPEDIAELASRFALASGAANGRGDIQIEPAALELMRSQTWPGNVRQLENFVERLVVFSDGLRIGRDDVARELLRDVTTDAELGPHASAQGGLRGARLVAEREAIREALRLSGNNRTRAARLLNMSRRTLYNKLDELGLL
jgi:two-component system response regulator AtoC